MAADAQTLITYENTKEVLQDFAEALVDAYRQGLKEYNAITSKNHFLYDSVSVHTVSVDGGHMVVSINLAEYWKYVEAGREAYGSGYKDHMPPIDAIEQWIKNKPFIPSDTQRGAKGAFTATLGALDVDTETRSLAWAVATNIAKNGIEPKPILRDSLKETMKNFKTLISEALAKDVGGSLQAIIGSLWSDVNLEKGEGGWTDTEIRDTMVL